jgi:hypothetical protein
MMDEDPRWLKRAERALSHTLAIIDRLAKGRDGRPLYELAAARRLQAELGAGGLQAVRDALAVPPGPDRRELLREYAFVTKAALLDLLVILLRVAQNTGAPYLEPGCDISELAEALNLDAREKFELERADELLLDLVGVVLNDEDELRNRAEPILERLVDLAERFSGALYVDSFDREQIDRAYKILEDMDDLKTESSWNVDKAELLARTMSSFSSLLDFFNRRDHAFDVRDGETISLAQEMLEDLQDSRP